jgi:hypothetical protein
METLTYDEAAKWLTANIKTTTDVEKLAAALKAVYWRHDTGTGARYSAVDNAIEHFWGGRGWSETVHAAVDRLRAHYGRLWNYTGD